MMLVIVILVIIMLLIILVIMHTDNAVPTIIQPGSFPSGNQHSSSVIIQSICTVPPGSIRSTLIFSHHSVHLCCSTGQYSVNTHLQSSFHPSLFNQALFRQASPLSSLSSVIILSIIISQLYSVRHHPCLPCFQSSFCPLFKQAVFRHASPLST